MVKRFTRLSVQAVVSVLIRGPHSDGKSSLLAALYKGRGVTQEQQT